MKMAVASRAESSAVALSYEFKPNGWAIFTFNDNTGEFTIQSDWGDFSHRWSPSDLGKPTLGHFLASVDVHYIADKLNIPRREFDAAGTRKRLRKLIREMRQELNISNSLAREMLEESERAISYANESEFLRSFERADVLRERFNEPWNAVAHKDSYQWRIFLSDLLPVFRDDMRKRIERLSRATAGAA